MLEYQILIRWQIRWHLVFAVTLWTLRNSSDFQDFNRTRWKVTLKMWILIHCIAGLIIRIILICLNSIFYFYFNFISPDETVVSLWWNFCFYAMEQKFHCVLFSIFCKSENEKSVSIKEELKCRSVIAVHGESAFRLFFVYKLWVDMVMAKWH